MADSAILTLAAERSALYHEWQFVWFSIHYAAGLVAIICGGLATAAGAKTGSTFIKKYAWVWGLLATVLSGIVTFLGPLQRAETYKYAYYELDPVIASYRDGKTSLDALNAATMRAQNRVLEGYEEPAQQTQN